MGLVLEYQFKFTAGSGPSPWPNHGTKWNAGKCGGLRENSLAASTCAHRYALNKLERWDE
jgi:hypothetical protein